jgi:hypothetical protein
MPTAFEGRSPERPNLLKRTRSAMAHYGRFSRRDWIDRLAPILTDDRSDSSLSRIYFATFTFDRCRNHYLTSAARCGLQSDVEVRATARDVRAGMTRTMPTEVRNRAYVGDVNRWYLRVIREMFGRYRDRYRAWHPRGVGFLDEPVGKSPGGCVRRRRHPGDQFLHAHLLLRVDDDCSGPQTTDGPLSLLDGWRAPDLGEQLSNVDRFERLDSSGRLVDLWLRQNPDGHLWIEALRGRDDVPRRLDEASPPPGDVSRSLSYVGKSAGRDRSLFDAPILLPFA